MAEENTQSVESTVREIRRKTRIQRGDDDVPDH